MHHDAKARVVAAVDAAVAAGNAPSELVLHPEHAAELGLRATHVDLGSDAWAPSKERMAAELAHPDYDRNPGRDDKGRPHAPDKAAEIAEPLCQAKLRRPGVVLLVVLDESMPKDKIAVHSTVKTVVKTEA